MDKGSAHFILARVAKSFKHLSRHHREGRTSGVPVIVPTVNAGYKPFKLKLIIVQVNASFSPEVVGIIRNKILATIEKGPENKTSLFERYTLITLKNERIANPE